MTLPKISAECLLATLQKATQQEPDEFAIETMLELAENQPGTLAAIQALTDLFTGAGFSGDEMPDKISVDYAKEMIAMSMICTLGVVLKALTATMEAADLEEQWG